MYLVFLCLLFLLCSSSLIFLLSYLVCSVLFPNFFLISSLSLNFLLFFLTHTLSLRSLFVSLPLLKAEVVQIVETWTCKQSCAQRHRSCCAPLALCRVIFCLPSPNTLKVCLQRRVEELPHSAP